MLTVACTYCSKTMDIPRREDMPAECPGCFKAWPEHARYYEGSSSGHIRSLSLLYLPHGGELEIPAADSVLLGRTHHGASLLGSIFNEQGNPVISRLHCEISFRDGQFFIADRHSTNGVFIGEAKYPCTDSPQPLPDGETLFLGRERFLTRINYTAPEPSIETSGTQPPRPHRYRCNEMGCGYETETLSPACPTCGAMNSLREV